MFRMTDYDRWLTTPPDDGYSDWVEQIIEVLPNDFHEKHQKWIYVYGGTFDVLLNNLWKKGKDPDEAASIIVRAKTLYKL